MQIFIYSRKSKWTGRGDSIENQAQMCREYIARYIEDSDKAEICAFEDEGYSGKNTHRPEFQKMMKEIKKGNCKYLVCYKLDRMGRNIIDIAGLVEELNKRNVAFVSIKENFDTSTPLGKTMLYIAGIFAQMEREQIAERVKDNMVMLARSGRWLGGNTPLGFSSEKEEQVCLDDKVKTAYILKENQEEMVIARFIFREFLEKQSLTKVVEHFLKNGILTKRGKEYTTTTVRDILTNPVYCIADEEAYDYFVRLGCQVCFERSEVTNRCGLIAYAKTSSSNYKNKENPPQEWIVALGKHKGEIQGKDFIKVQKLIQANSYKSETYRKVKNEIALLSGILYCTCGHTMRPKYYNVKQVTEEGQRKFSYICPYKDMTHGEKCSVDNVPGNDLDEMVCKELFRYAEPNFEIKKMLFDLKREILESKEQSVGAEELLQKSLEEKESQIKSLLISIQKPGRSSEFVDRVDLEIQRLSREGEELRIKIKSAKQEEQSLVFDIRQVDLIIDALDTFAGSFEKLTVQKKREYLKLLLEKVVWDGEQAHIYL